MNRALRIGLTGGIGSGKSTVAALFQRLGAGVIDADAQSRTLTATGGAALPALRAAFGPDIIQADGSLDRQRMRTLVFGDPVAKAKLEAILHPMIAAENEKLERSFAGRPVVFDVPLRAESVRWRQRVDRVVVVDCSASVQTGRVLARSNWTRDEVERVMAQQASREVRRTCADAVIDNEHDGLRDLESQVTQLWQLWIVSPQAT